MAETTTGVFLVSKDLSANLYLGTFKCSCGTTLSSNASVQKGSDRTFTCTKCKKKVLVHVPK